jgi:hypothetical protein
MRRIHAFSGSTIILALSLGYPGFLQGRVVPPIATQTQQATNTRVELLLRNSGYPYRRTSANTWVIERPGGRKGWVLVAAGQEFVVLGIIVAEKQNMRVSADLSFRLLKLNHDLNYVKVGFDNDDDLFARLELRIRLVDLPAFKTMYEDVNSGADKTYEVVRPFLMTP